MGVKTAGVALNEICEDAERSLDLEALDCACEFLLLAHARLGGTERG
eukprot:CAMPEP_0197688146 /NCGR_PEP_ID=MMETSP1338-20131121/105010_1 /TAXON_ID=43686 ORGANISM="Pelagodinium beii, Strain RCC1491" /NCGR_SAMPLE_ID=MMETSP1338 /ASSEMBLY_ACC=CAM_ASM_000754 /LENGTH=46 /DNA_ID= /DNA_START= /DNA_END= /DNA_ORIENTATION=